MRASHLQDILVLLCLLFQRSGKVIQGLCHLVALVGQADLDCRRQGIIRGLRHIRMIVRRDDIVTAFLLADDFQSAIAENLIHVHVDGRARAALDGIDRELVDKLSVNDLLCCLHKSIADFLVQTARLHICLGSGLLYLCHGLDEILVQLASRDAEILNGTHGLYAIIHFIRYLKFSQKIMLFSHVSHVPFLKILPFNIL